MTNTDIIKSFREENCYIGTLGPDVWSKEFLTLPEYKQVEVIIAFLTTALNNQRDDIRRKVEGRLKELEDMKGRHPNLANFAYKGGKLMGESILEDLESLQ